MSRNLLNKKLRLGQEAGWGEENNSGGALLFHAESHVVSSAWPGLTAEFGMGSGVDPTRNEYARRFPALGPYGHPGFFGGVKSVS